MKLLYEHLEGFITVSSELFESLSKLHLEIVLLHTLRGGGKLDLHVLIGQNPVDSL